MIDWNDVFVPSMSLLEIMLRGTLMYLALFAMLRLVLKRESGAIGVTDLLVIVLVADAAQNALAADYMSITEGIVLVATILFWSWALSWLGFKVPAVRRFVHPEPLELVRNGHLLWNNMEKELITEEELMSKLRQQGVDKIDDVKKAAIEGDGHISVVTRTPGEARNGAEQQAVT
jgi:uncharacterized membrane protein YcaP (DUF421 family)